MTDFPALPPNVRTVFLPTGEEVVEYTGSEFGNQPEWAKEFLPGKGIIIRGLSDDTFHPEGSAFAPARSVLYNLMENDPQPDEPWGMFFTDCGDEDPRTSPFIRNVRKELRRNGGRPFLTDVEYIDSQAHKGQGYWNLKRFVRNVTPEPAPKGSK